MYKFTLINEILQYFYMITLIMIVGNLFILNNIKCLHHVSLSTSSNYIIVVNKTLIET